MASNPGDDPTYTALTELPERQRQRAFERYQTLRPRLEQDVPRARVAMEAAFPLRTAQGWVSRYRRFGLAGSTRAGRANNGKRRRGRSPSLRRRQSSSMRGTVDCRAR